VVANFAVFDQHLKGFQVLEFTGVQFVTFNVAKARSTGAEFEITARVSPSLTANASYTFTNARYPIDCAGASTNLSILSLCGQTLTNAPRHVVISGLNYDRNIGRDLNIGLNGSVRLESDRRTSTQAVVVGTTIPTPFDIQDGNAKVDLRFGVGSQNGLWRIEVWGNNLTDAFTRSVTFNTALRGTTSAAGGANAIGQARSANFAEPRTFGVTVRSRF
jgi:outer membrane receptor for ferric coprogen and ferric-rhodotorulic acid